MALSKGPEHKVKVVVSLSADLVEKIEAFGREMGINRTAAVSILCSNSLKYDKALSDMSELLQEFKKAQKN